MGYKFYYNFFKNLLYYLPKNADDLTLLQQTIVIFFKAVQSVCIDKLLFVCSR